MPRLWQQNPSPSLQSPVHPTSDPNRVEWGERTPLRFDRQGNPPAYHQSSAVENPASPGSNVSPHGPNLTAKRPVSTRQYLMSPKCLILYALVVGGAVWLLRDVFSWSVELAARKKLERDDRGIKLEKERIELEKQRGEEKRREAGTAWQDFKDQKCVRFGIRKYTAKLENIPEGYGKMKACWETQTWIQGKAVYPSECKDHGLWGGVEGLWYIDYDATCNPFWQQPQDKGCTARGSGKRRIESHLDNWGDGDWVGLCSSTPAAFHGLHFERPDSCVTWGKLGVWFIQDAGCR